MNDWISILVGALTGILSGWGCGGGTLLLLYLVSFAGMQQAVAQGINLLYFLPCSAAALYGHWKHHYVERTVLLPAILAGTLATVAAALLATTIRTALLEKLFGAFLLITGIRELLRR
ncbi:MAG: TSUP family transporter [Oscillospiraceae bacterium]|jgi:uncharacterized membrane protein YfcA